jgi:HPt (histidine-containing phosphotransfer) domain-containing protein
LLADLKKDYIADLPNKITLITALLKSGDSDLLETEFHKLKGTGQTYGVPEVTRLGEMIESICQKPKAQRDPLIVLALELLTKIFVAYSANQPFDWSCSEVGELSHQVEQVLKST